jgi:hypothetical protein
MVHPDVVAARPECKHGLTGRFPALAFAGTFNNYY